MTDAAREFLGLASAHYLQRGGPSLASSYRVASAEYARRTGGGKPPVTMGQARRHMATPQYRELAAMAR